MNLKPRFEVSTEGMKGLHDGRPLWSLVKELVANAWDEKTTMCAVDIRVIPEGSDKTEGADRDILGESTEERDIIITVEDDGRGFSDVADAYTLMAPTSKRQDSGVRGRFNIGEKEILSVAKSGRVITVGTTIEFPEEGGRIVKANKRKKGTIVTAKVRRPAVEAWETKTQLLNFIPPKGIKYSVNWDLGMEAQVTMSEIAEPRDLIHSGKTSRTIKSVLSSGVGQPLRVTRRKCDFQVYEPTRLNHEDEPEGHLYEMGIFIQTIEMPYDVDIQMKVPMPPNRDTVTAEYLQDIYAETLMVVADRLTESEASEAWVQRAIEDERTDDATISMIMTVKLGENAVLWSSDTLANERAHDAGMNVIQPKTLGKAERERFKKVGLVTSRDGFAVKGESAIFDLAETTPLEITEDMKKVGEYARWLSNTLLGFECTVRFIGMRDVFDNRIAQYNRGTKTLDFVVDALGKKWFRMSRTASSNADGKLVNYTPTEEQTSLIIHELAHEGEIDHMSHTGAYVHRIADLGAKAIHIASTGQWFTFTELTPSQ